MPGVSPVVLRSPERSTTAAGCNRAAATIAIAPPIEAPTSATRRAPRRRSSAMAAATSSTAWAAAAGRTPGAPEAAQIEQQRPHAVAREVAGVRHPPARITWPLVEQHRSDRTGPNDGARQDDAVARAEADGLGAHAGRATRKVGVGRSGSGGRGLLASARTGVA